MIAAVAFALLALVPQASPASGITGIVRDSSGTPLAGATVLVRSASGGEERTTAGTDGRFTANVATSGDVTIIVRLEGFAEHRQTLRSEAPRQALEVTLS